MNLTQPERWLAGIHDVRFGATPLGWAEHFGQAATAELLRPLTSG